MGDVSSGITWRELIAGTVEIAPSPGCSEAFGKDVPEKVRRGLEKRGIHSLYGHQREAFEHAARGENVVIATPAASGKSLGYILPLLDALECSPESSALLLYPTKALSRDQEKAIRGYLEASGIGASAVTYDGDTPPARRKALRAQGGVIITNPDMLHAAVLPRHPSWADLFSSLAFIVIDEIHQYRGVFGSHVANVFRRLSRILDFYGSRPVWIAASATIGNPREIAGALTGRSFHLIDRSDAPSPGRRLHIVEAPLTDRGSGARLSYLRLSSRIAVDLIAKDMQTIVFANSRNAVELLFRYIRDELAGAGRGADGVRAYRGGYLPGLRREIEGELKSGTLRCVVATSALELGIDIGRLDAVVMAGYPGTISGLWQRVGRVGRRRKTGLAVLVAGGSPIDRFLVRNIDYITGSNPESCYINPDNLEILLPHVRCALSEVPFRTGDTFDPMEADELKEVLDFLISGGEASLAGDRYHWIAGSSPAREISLRTAGSERFTIMDMEAGSTIEEMERSRVLRTMHPRALYQHAGTQYEVEDIDFERRTVKVREVSLDYYTEPLTDDKLDVIDEYDSSTAGRCDVSLGEIRLTQKVVGYKCVKYYTSEIVSVHDTALPEQEMEVSSLWLKVRSSLFGNLLGIEDMLGGTIPRDWSSALALTHPVKLMMDGLKGLGYLMCNIGALRLMCDPKDLGASVSCDFIQSSGADDQAAGRLYIYEIYPGGVGVVKGFYERFAEIAADSLEVASSCGCRAGCPSCVNPPEGREDLRKITAVILLESIASGGGGRA